MFIAFYNFDDLNLEARSRGFSPDRIKVRMCGWARLLYKGAESCILFLHGEYLCTGLMV